MKEKIRNFANFWLLASWVTKAFLACLALLITWRLVTSCIRVGIINLEVGCKDSPKIEDPFIRDYPGNRGHYEPHDSRPANQSKR